MYYFTLHPFSQTNTNNLRVSGNIFRKDGVLEIVYELSGSLDLIHIPAPEIKRLRKNNLWKNTCFELFLKTKNVDPYWEFNLSPAGNWNIYHFDDYRKGMVEETIFSKLLFEVKHQPESFQMKLKIRLGKFIPDDQPLQAGISAVIQDKGGKINYWALAHPGKKPDFHLKDSFCIEL